MDDTLALRGCVRAEAQRLELKGDVLLVTEGVNLVLAADADAGASTLSAAKLSRWLGVRHDHAGRPVTTLDTGYTFELDRGDFEGTFDQREALDPALESQAA